jgi:TRAP-type C4-dicarboxylate transport system permease small subunit
MERVQLGTAATTVLGVLTIAALALIWGGWQMIMRRGDRKKGTLMLACAFVLILNVLIWTV